MAAAADEGPFPLLALDPRTRNLFLKKLDYLTVAQLEATCSSMKESCGSLCPIFRAGQLRIFPGNQDWLVRQKYPGTGAHQLVAVLPTDEAVPCELRVYNTRLETILTAEKAKLIVDRIRLYNLTSRCLDVYGDFTPENLVQVIEALKISEITIVSNIARRELCTFAAFQNLSSIIIKATDLEEEDLLRLKASLIVITESNLNPTVIRGLVKQWKAGERNVVLIDLLSLPISPLDRIDESIKNLETTELRTVLTNNDLLMKKIIHSVRRSGDSQQLEIVFENNSVKIRPVLQP